MKKIGKRLLLISLGIVLAFLFSFIVDDVVDFFLNKNGYFKATTPNVTQVYNTFEFNSIATISAQGIRNEEVKIPKPKGVYRILALGDSFTYGWGVSLAESWPKQLEKGLKTKGGKAEVINAGIPGANTVDEQIICRAYLDRFDVDIVVLGLASLDDLYQVASREDSMNSFSKFIRNNWGVLSRINQPIIVPAWSKNVKEGDVIDFSKKWENEALNSLQVAPNILSRVDKQIVDYYLSGRINPGLIANAYFDPNYFTNILDNAKYDFALKAMDQELKKLKENCTGNKPTVVLNLPTSLLVSSKFFPYRNGEGYNVDERLLSLDLRTALEKSAKNYGFYYFGLTSLFRQEDCFDCFYPWDYHLTPLGHKKVADYIAPQITDIIDSTRRN